MPINTSVRSRDFATGTAKISAGRQTVQVFGFIGTHECGAALEADRDPRPGAGDGGRRGRRAGYPPAAFLAICISARAWTSLASCLKALRDEPGLWEQCVEAYEARSGHWLPAAPPSREQVRYFRDRLLSDREAMQRLHSTFRDVAVGQARLLGNLRAGVVPNWAAPAAEHLIYGDGTNIAKYSDAILYTDPRTGAPLVVGSRASHPSRARVQGRITDTSPDGKKSNGLNMVAVHTWTAAGRVTLATATAFGAEQWAALDLVESVAERARDGVHTLLYDRAVTGWAVCHLMANCRIQVIGKAVASSTKSTEKEKLTDPAIDELTERRLAEHPDANPGLARAIRRDTLAEMLRYQDRLPLGLDIYPRSGHGFDVVRGWSRVLDPITHEGPDGECRHDVAIDDGGLYEVAKAEDEDGTWVKTRMLRCLRSEPFRQDNGRWGTNNQYLIPCGDDQVPYSRLWEPEGTRFTPSSKRTERAPHDPIGWRLRPLSRGDDIAAWYNADPSEDVDHFTSAQPFTAVFSRRNDSESYNEWYQQSLPHHGRAASLSLEGQDLDFLLAALLNNCLTWHNRQPN